MTLSRIQPWSEVADYEVGDLCLYAGRVWWATAPTRGTPPGMTTDGPWALFGVPAEAAVGNTRGNPHVTEVGP